MYVYITIDTEAAHGDLPVDRMIWGKLDGVKGEYGIGLIADICQQHGVPATFFLDVYEYSYYGEQAMKDVAIYLDKRGFDVQLHTHPAWYPDDRDSPIIRDVKRKKSCFSENKYWMRMNSFDEQVDILRHGKELLEKWINKPVVAHRAGAYALNLDTLKALKEVGISIDSSMHFGHPNCYVNYSINQTVACDGILEIPITGFFREVIWNALFKYKHPVRFCATNINGTAADEILSFTKQAEFYDAKVVVLFLHSYSFVKFNHNFTKFKINTNAIENFKKVLYEFQNENHIFVNSRDLVELYKDSPYRLLGDLRRDGAPKEVTNKNLFWLAMRKAYDRFS